MKDPYAEGMVPDGMPADAMKDVPLPRPKPQKVNRAKKSDALKPISKMANGGVARGDGASRVKTKGKMC